jgi:hypothetical protein
MGSVDIKTEKSKRRRKCGGENLQREKCRINECARTLKQIHLREPECFV